MDSLSEQNAPQEIPQAESPAKVPEYSGEQKISSDSSAFPKPPTSEKSLIPEIPQIAVLGTLLLVVLFDYFIYQGTNIIGGIGLGVLFLLVAVIIWLMERPLTPTADLPKAQGSKKGLQPPFSYKILICAILLVIFTLRTIWQSILFGGMYGFLIIFIFSCSVKRFSLHIPELSFSFMWTWLRLPFVFIGFGKVLSQLGQKFPAWTKRIFRIGIIWFIPAVIVLLFIILFALGNIVVESWVNKALDTIWEQLLHILDYFPSIGHIFFWIFSSICAVVLLLPQEIRFNIFTAVFGEEEIMKPKTPLPLADLWATVAINTLIAVNVLFLFYNAIDIYYLWIQKSLPAGLTYSAYARSGTLWLTMALALTSLVLGITFLRDLNFHRRTPILKTLSWIWVAQNLILASETFHRLVIYINYNGLTRMRIVGAYGIILVVIGMLIVAFKMHGVRSFLWMLRRHILAFALALFALTVTPMDYLVSRYNTHIILNDNLRPAIQLTVQPLTAEGIPPLIPLLKSNDQTIRKGVAGIFLREQEKLQQLQDKKQRWTDKELSYLNALKSIKSVKSELNQIIPDGDWQKAIDRMHEYTKRWY